MTGADSELYNSSGTSINSGRSIKTLTFSAFVFCCLMEEKTALNSCSKTTPELISYISKPQTFFGPLEYHSADTTDVLISKTKEMSFLSVNFNGTSSIFFKINV